MDRQYPLGAIPSPSDSRDWNLKRLIPTAIDLPEKFCLPYQVIRNQESVGACVAESLALSRDIKEFLQDPSGYYKQFSEEWIYGNRGLDDFQYIDDKGSIWADFLGEGMIPRIAIARLKKYGIPAKEDVPSLKLVEWQQAQEQVKNIYEETLPKAYPHRITAYCRLYTPEEIKLAIYTLGAVSIMISCWDWSMDENYILHHKNDIPISGYHEMTLIGWREDGTFICPNSWGEEWGDKGLCYIPFDFPIVEAWSMTDDVLPDKIEPEPIPNPLSNLFSRIWMFLKSLFKRIFNK